jgi:hypothetical protein
MNRKEIIFEKEVSEGKYQAIRSEHDSVKEISMVFLRKGKSKIFWDIQLSGNEIKIVAPFLGIRWPTFSGRKSETYIEIPKQLDFIETQSYPDFLKKFLTSSESGTILAWINLNGKRKNLGYFGQPGPGVYGLVTQKEMLKILSKELGIEIRQMQ